MPRAGVAEFADGVLLATRPPETWVHTRRVDELIRRTRKERVFANAAMRSGDWTRAAAWQERTIVSEHTLALLMERGEAG